MSEVSVLGLPGGVGACLFGLDGVLTETATVQAAAWKEMSGACLRARARTAGGPSTAFDPVGGYDAFVDGMPRADGARSFLAASGIWLPDVGRGDRPGAGTVRGLGGRKNQVVLRRICQAGVQAYDGSVRCVRSVRAAGLRRAAVSTSTNCADVLAAAGPEGLFGERAEGLTAERDHLAGKPAPDMFLAAARALGAAPADAAVSGDALAGVAAGRGGGFGFAGGAELPGAS